MLFNVLQLIGGIMLSFGYIPQIIQIVKTKSTEDLNMKTFVMTLIGISLMETYAINLVVHGSGIAFLITNSLSLITAAVIVILMITYRRKKNSAKN